MRAVDLLARLGGEEFLIVLPNTGRADARHAALRLCQRISETGMAIPGQSAKIDVTVSIGLALSGPDQDLETRQRAPRLQPSELLSRADKALYRAKEQGRNRFMLERSAA